jgi:hypothetical protein
MHAVMRSLLAFALLASTPIVACTGGVDIRFNPKDDKAVESSAAIDSKDMSFDMSAQSNTEGLEVFARLDYAFQTGIPLAPSDVLVATVGGIAYEMKKDGIHYKASFAPTTSPADVVISLTRPPSRVTAPASTVRAPAPFQIISAPATITDGDVVRFELSPPPPDGARVTFRFAPPNAGAWNTFDGSSCLYAWDGPVYEAGSTERGVVTLDTTKVFYKRPTARVAPACDATVFVRYETEGTLDAAFKGGTISGLRETGRVVHIVRVPGN